MSSFNLGLETIVHSRLRLNGLPVELSVKVYWPRKTVLYRGSFRNDESTFGRASIAGIKSSSERIGLTRTHLSARYQVQGHFNDISKASSRTSGFWKVGSPARKATPSISRNCCSATHSLTSFTFFLTSLNIPSVPWSPSNTSHEVSSCLSTFCSTSRRTELSQ